MLDNIESLGSISEFRDRHIFAGHPYSIAINKGRSKYGILQVPINI